jgi:ABC-type phosphate/phosphonate transport system ATPase subunit
MSTIHNIIIVGDKGVGKTKLIHFIKSGNTVSKTIPVLGVDYPFIMINNRTYSRERFGCMFRKRTINETSVVIVANANIPNSLTTIPMWLKKTKNKYPHLNILLVLLNSEKCAMSDIFNILYLCSLDNAKLIRL